MDHFIIHPKPNQMILAFPSPLTSQFLYSWSVLLLIFFYANALGYPTSYLPVHLCWFYGLIFPAIRMFSGVSLLKMWAKNNICLLLFSCVEYSASIFSLAIADILYDIFCCITSGAYYRGNISMKHINGSDNAVRHTSAIKLTWFVCFV